MSTLGNLGEYQVKCNGDNSELKPSVSFIHAVSVCHEPDPV